jgi:Site-specific DNA methylase
MGYRMFGHPYAPTPMPRSARVPSCSAIQITGCLGDQYPRYPNTKAHRIRVAQILGSPDTGMLKPRYALTATHPDSPTHPTGSDTLLPFLGCKLCFCTYSPAMPRRTHKNQLATEPRALRDCSGTVEGKKLATRFFLPGGSPDKRITNKENAMLRHGSLFSGIGGFDIAAQWMGWQNVFTCERDAFCRTILKHHWPETPHYEDIHDFNAIEFRGRVDVISGGFPCQPFSTSGRRGGTDDDRYLFPEALRIISEVRPRWIVLENVAGLFSILEPLGLSEMEVQAVELFCQDGQQQTNSTILRIQRRVIGSILTEIESAGYFLPRLEDGTPIVLCIPACAVGAVHRRDRVWFVAHADGLGDQQPDECADAIPRRTGAERPENRAGYRRTGVIDRTPDLLHADGSVRRPSGQGDRQDAPSHAGNAPPAVADPSGNRADGIPLWDGRPTESPFCGLDDGVPRGLDGIGFRSWRVQSIKAYGNAIVPQVALEIFRAIEAVTIQRRHGS